MSAIDFDSFTAAAANATPCYIRPYGIYYHGEVYWDAALRKMTIRHSTNSPHGGRMDVLARILGLDPLTLQPCNSVFSSALVANGWQLEFEVFELMSLSDYAQERGWHPNAVCRKLADPACPWFEDIRGGTTRLRQLRPNLALNAFVKKKGSL